MDRYKILAWTAIVISIALLILPRIVPICTGLANGNPMRCHYAYQAEFIIALLAVLFAVSLLVLRTTEARLLAAFTLILFGILVIVLPQHWAMGICVHGGACHETTFFATIGGSLLILAGAGIAWLTRKEQAA